MRCAPPVHGAPLVGTSSQPLLCGRRRQAPYPPVTMSGFANRSVASMRAFNASQLPVKIALAKEFGLFNNLSPHPEPEPDPEPEHARNSLASSQHYIGCPPPSQPAPSVACTHAPWRVRVITRRYAALPGPSQPNHMFAQSATSCGVTETGTVYEECGGILPLFPQKASALPSLRPRTRTRILGHECRGGRGRVGGARALGNRWVSRDAPTPVFS